MLSEQEKYDFIGSKDKKYDGKFYTAVKTTGIFCLPSCRARKPIKKNVILLLKILSHVNLLLFRILLMIYQEYCLEIPLLLGWIKNISKELVDYCFLLVLILLIKTLVIMFLVI